MKLSHSFAFFITASLHFSTTLGADTTAEDTDDASMLSIPIADVIGKKLGAYESHPLFSKYSDWVKTSEEAQAIIANPNDSEIVSPNLVGVECYPDEPECSFFSAVDFKGSDAEWEDLIQTVEADDSSPSRLFARAPTTVWKPNLEIKTFINKKGHVHRIRYNLKCKVLTYRSPNYQLVSHDIRKNTPFPGQVTTEVVGKDFTRKPFITIQFFFLFSCKKGGPQCCIKESRIQRIESKAGFSSPPKTDCKGGSKAKGKCK